MDAGGATLDRRQRGAEGEPAVAVAVPIDALGDGGADGVAQADAPRAGRVLKLFEPPCFAAALWRALLLAIYWLIEVLVVFGDEHATERCLELLETAEVLADTVARRA